jgi:sugar (pentulose or hexulose) kinase
MEWVRDHVALGEIGVCLEQKTVTDDSEGGTRVSSTFPARRSGVLVFAPWLHQLAATLADVLGETIEPVASPQKVGALGAALLCASGPGLIGEFEEAARLLPVAWVHEPESKDAGV